MSMNGPDFWLHAVDDFGGADSVQPMQDILNGMAPQGATYPPAEGYRVVNRDPEKFAGMRGIMDFAARGAYDNSPGKDVYEVRDDMGRLLWTGDRMPEIPDSRTGREFFIRKNNIGMKVEPGWNSSMVEYAFESHERLADFKVRQDKDEMQKRRATAALVQQREAEATQLREEAMKAAVTPPAAVDYREAAWNMVCRQSAIQTSHQDEMFARWTFARQQFIDTGDDFWRAKMEESIEEDVDLYDDKAEADIAADRKKSAAELEPAAADVSLLMKLLNFIMFWRKSA